MAAFVPPHDGTPVYDRSSETYAHFPLAAPVALLVIGLATPLDVAATQQTDAHHKTHRSTGRPNRSSQLLTGTAH
ncbi:hypothetical protein [Streptomyces sp. N2A]|uniref:hypothetical protein n=1 Tax=Streptomyces sp. N2A TaxID=3073936 RepID=UPI00287059A1|nr:hypothetical protein [Streptomyces sp. N2A]